MKCKKCGAEIPKEAAFCPACGEKKKKSHKKLILTLVLIVVLLATIGGVTLFVMSTKNKPDNKAQNLALYVIATHQFATLEGDTFEPGVLEGLSYCTATETTFYAELNGECKNLYAIKKDLLPVAIAKDINTFYVSLTGEYVAYTTNEGDDSRKCSLYLYNVKKDKSTEIDTDVYPDDIALSPSGKTVAYLKDYEGREDNTLYLGGIGIKVKKVDKDGCYPIAISDNAKNMYYMNTNYKFYYYNGKDTTKVQVDVNGSFWFNNTISEVLFTKDSRTYYYNPKQEEPVKIANYDMDSYLTGSRDIYSTPWCSSYGEIINKKTLKDTLIMDDNNLLYLKNDLSEAVKVASIYGEDIIISSDGKSIMYVRDGVLYKAGNYAKESDEVIMYDKDYVNCFVASADLSKVYVVLNSKELYYLKGKNKLDKVSMDIETDQGMPVFNEFTKKIYYIEDHDLYEAGTKAKSAQVVEEDILGVAPMVSGIVFYTEDEEHEFYYMGDGEPVYLYTVEE